MTSMTSTRPRQWLAILAVRILGALLLADTGAIHLYLYLHGYRTTAIIGPLFLLNGVLAGIAAVLVLITPRRWLGLVALAGGLLELGTLAALVVSLTVGLFGFHESTKAPLVGTTIAVESAGTIILFALSAVTRPLFRWRHSSSLEHPLPR